MRILTVIPARLAATRLPNKPLLDIGGKPMVIQTALRALEADIGDVLIAAGDPEIVDLAKEHQIKACLTDPQIPSGTDRVFAAATQIDSGDYYNIVINLQGDMPLIEADSIKQSVEVLTQTRSDIATLVAPFDEDDDLQNPNCVKAVIEWTDDKTGTALYFSRTPVPYGATTYYHHIGLYAFKRRALENFVALPITKIEQTERLEQLRALANGMTISAGLTSQMPLSVDTPQDLEKVRASLRGEFAIA